MDYIRGNPQKYYHAKSMTLLAQPMITFYFLFNVLDKRDFSSFWGSGAVKKLKTSSEKENVFA